MALGATAIMIVAVLWLAARFSEQDVSDAPFRAPPASHVSLPEPPVDLARTSTLIAYQNAFNQSLEELDTLLARNTARSPSGDGMMLSNTRGRLAE